MKFNVVEEQWKQNTFDQCSNEFANERKRRRDEHKRERNYETVEARKIFRVKRIYKCN